LRPALHWWRLPSDLQLIVALGLLEVDRIMEIEHNSDSMAARSFTFLSTLITAVYQTGISDVNFENKFLAFSFLL
jgi:hypothetical protein